MRGLDYLNAWFRGRDGWRRTAALASGLALALAFPFPGWAGLAWAGPGLLFFSVRGAPPGAAFRMGYLAGLTHFLVSLAWLRLMPFPAGAYAAWLALSAYLALFWGLWALGVSLPALAPEKDPWTGEWLPVRERAANPDAAWGDDLRGWTALPWTRRAAGMGAAALWWVATEYLRGWLFTGFPWNFLGVTQWRNAPLLQIASVTGVYGVSFLVAWCSLALVSALLLVALANSKRMGWLAEARVPLFALLAATGLGFYRIVHFGPRDAPGLRLALVQPGIPQSLIWDASQSTVRFEKITDLSRQALATRPDVLIWPEASLDFDGEEAFRRMQRLTTEARTPWIFGADDAETPPSGRRRQYNAAWMMGADGRVGRPYHKRRLVIFGEYVPLADKLPFLRWLTPIGEGFSAGAAPSWFSLAAESGDPARPAVSVAPVICFEDIFPGSTREHVRPDTDFLLEMTNDGWFQESAAQWQHAANVALRSVENGVPLVRCANNGLTCWFDGCGRLRDLLGGSGRDVYQSGFLLANVPLAAAGQARALTFYRERGDWFPQACLALGAGRLGAGAWRRRQTRRPAP